MTYGWTFTHSLKCKQPITCLVGQYAFQQANKQLYCTVLYVMHTNRHINLYELLLDSEPEEMA